MSYHRRRQDGIASFSKSLSVSLGMLQSYSFLVHAVELRSGTDAVLINTSAGNISVTAKSGPRPLHLNHLHMDRHALTHMVGQRCIARIIIAADKNCRLATSQISRVCKAISRRDFARQRPPSFTQRRRCRRLRFFPSCPGDLTPRTSYLALLILYRFAHPVGLSNRVRSPLLLARMQFTSRFGPCFVISWNSSDYRRCLQHPDKASFDRVSVQRVDSFRNFILNCRILYRLFLLLCVLLSFFPM